MHLVGSIGQPQIARVDTRRCSWEIARHADAAMDLHSPVSDSLRHAGRYDLDRGDEILGDLVAMAIHRVGSLQGK
jgi:hypothetical protein